MTDQTEVAEFLKDPATHGGAAVEVVETHGALVFLAGDTALKMKRAVRYDYMDLSTLDLREAMLRRELELNRPAAPQIYRDVVPVTRQGQSLALGGTGEPVEWLLRMRRFPAEDELAVIADRGGFTLHMAEDLGHALQVYHRAAPIREADGAVLIRDILDELRRVFADMGEALGAEHIGAFDAAARAALDRLSGDLTARGKAGHVRRCHGDLHLRNLVLIEGRPVPFDALEFDETLGTCDVLYDLAFLLMDLAHRGLGWAANATLAAWLMDAQGTEDAGLAALPLFLAVRGAIRAMVLVQTDAASGADRSGPEARRFLSDAVAALTPDAARLVVVGGLSGSGKTTLARRLAPRFGATPGAVHLRSDTERKAMSGVDAGQRLDAVAYAPQDRAKVYRHMLDRAKTLLAAGRSVLLDATFLDAADRAAAEQLAAAAHVRFTGLWLDAPKAVLMARVAARAGDASDADAAVVRAQAGREIGALHWTRIAAAGAAEDALDAALCALD